MILLLKKPEKQFAAILDKFSISVGLIYAKDRQRKFRNIGSFLEDRPFAPLMRNTVPSIWIYAGAYRRGAYVARGRTALLFPRRTLSLLLLNLQIALQVSVGLIFESRFDRHLLQQRARQCR